MLKPHWLLCSVIVASGCDNKAANNDNDANILNPKIPAELMQEVNEKIGSIKPLLQHEAVMAALQQSNALHQVIPKRVVMEFDAMWRQQQLPEKTLEWYRLNDCGKNLQQAMAADSTVVAVYITNKFGANVCQTAVSNDYYQADEKWWQHTYNKGFGKQSYGRASNNKITANALLSLYLPIIQPENKRVIGISEVVLQLKAK